MHHCCKIIESGSHGANLTMFFKVNYRRGTERINTRFTVVLRETISAWSWGREKNPKPNHKVTNMDPE